MRPLAFLAALLAAAPAAAQSIGGGVEVATDEARRGLSWSAGRVSPAADLWVDAAGVTLSARIAATRGSPRHAGADAATTLAIGRTWRLGAFDVEARATGRLFTGANRRMDYGEAGLTGRFDYGPLQLSAGADFAPAQSAIGGSNLYLRAGASAGIPATPVTIVAAIGHSSGSDDTDPRSARLRPAGSYADWRVGVEHVTGPLTLALDYVGTDVDRGAATSPYADAVHAGDRIVGRARLSF